MQTKRASIQTDVLQQYKHELQTQQGNLQHQIGAKSVSSKVDNNKLENEQNVNGYRFELVPDHHYSHQVEQYQANFNQQQGQCYSRKLQGAYILQNALSRMTATLFISCWESLKQLLCSQTALYHRLDEASQNRQIYKESVSKQILQILHNQPKQTINEVNVLPLTSKSIQELKIEILQRHKRGFTLDSLGKIKQARSKSKDIKHIKPQHDITLLKNDSLKSNKTNKETIAYEINQSQHEAQINKQKSQQSFDNHQTNQTNQILQKEQQKKYITLQGGYHKLLRDTKFTHHDFSYQQLTSANTSPYPLNPFSVPFSYKSNSQLGLHTNNLMQQNKNAIQTKINTVNIQHNEMVDNKQQIQRVHILTEIANKLQFSKLRMQKRQNKNGYDFEIIRKILRLQKAIEQIKQQDKQTNKETKSTYYESSLQQTNKNPQTQKQSMQNFALKKLLQQIQLIRQDINEIKTLSLSKRQENSSKIIERQNNFIFGKNDDHLGQKESRNHINYKNNLYQIPTPIVRIQDASRISVKIQPKVQTNNISFSNKVYRKVHKQEKSQIYQLQERQKRQQQVRIMVQNVRKARYEQSKTYMSDLDRARPIRGNYENEWKKLYQQRRHLRNQDDNCCVLMDYC